MTMMNKTADYHDHSSQVRLESMDEKKSSDTTPDALPSQEKTTCLEGSEQSLLLKDTLNKSQKRCVNLTEEKESVLDMEEQVDEQARIDCCEDPLPKHECEQTTCLQKCSSTVPVNLHQNFELPLENESPTRYCSSKKDYDKLKCKQSVRLSLISGTSVEGSCRICHCDGQEEQLISPCRCSGSLQHVHETCLVQWLQSKMEQNCELCQARIEFARKIKPVWLWKRPTQRPSSVLWFLLFVVTIHLNVISVVKDASNRCISTPCIVFYMVGCIGAVLATAFSVYFGRRVKDFFKHWININEEWVILNKNSKGGAQKSGSKDKLFTQIFNMFSSNRLTTIV